MNLEIKFGWGGLTLEIGTGGWKWGGSRGLPISRSERET